MGIRPLAATAALLPLLGGCTILGLDDVDELERLQRAEARWAEAAPREYSFLLGRLCYCAAPLRVVVVVEDGQVVSLLSAEPGGEEVAEEMRPHYPSVEGLFQVIRRALAEADGMEVTYDATTGAPLRIAIDWYRDAVDDEVTYEVSGLSAAVPEPTGDVDLDRSILQGWRALLHARAGTACTSLADCRYVAMGAKACGGPAEYLVYSAAATEEDLLLEEVAAYTAFNARLDAHYGWGSTCDLPAVPVLGVRRGHCVDLGAG